MTNKLLYWGRESSQVCWIPEPGASLPPLEITLFTNCVTSGSQGELYLSLCLCKMYLMLLVYLSLKWSGSMQVKWLELKIQC